MTTSMVSEGSALGTIKTSLIPHPAAKSKPMIVRHTISLFDAKAFELTDGKVATDAAEAIKNRLIDDGLQLAEATEVASACLADYAACMPGPTNHVIFFIGEIKGGATAVVTAKCDPWPDT